MKDIWTVFCGAPGCSNDNGKFCYPDFGSMTDPSSCINHVLIICCDVILLLIFLYNLFSKTSLRTTNIPARFQGFSRLQLISAIFNGFLGLLYLAFGFWILEDKVMKNPQFITSTLVVINHVSRNDMVISKLYHKSSRKIFLKNPPEDFVNFCFYLCWGYLRFLSFCCHSCQKGIIEDSFRYILFFRSMFIVVMHL